MTMELVLFRRSVGAHGIYVSGASDNIIEGNRFYNNAGFGIQLYSGSGGG